MTKDKLPVADCDEVAVAEDRSCQACDETLLSLLTQAKEGSVESYQLLRLRYRPLIDASVSRFTTDVMTLQEKEDLREEAERIFLNAVSTYDTEQEAVDFGLYAKICLRNGLVSEVRSLNVRIPGVRGASPRGGPGGSSCGGRAVSPIVPHDPFELVHL